MRKIYESSFVYFEFDREKSLLLEKWLPKEINRDIYQKEIIQKLEILQACKPELILDDVSENTFTIEPDLQEWTEQVMGEVLENIGLKKYALVFHEELFAQVSLEQTIEEFSEKVPPFEVKMFKNRQDAAYWLTN